MGRESSGRVESVRIQSVKRVSYTGYCREKGGRVEVWRGKKGGKLGTYV